MFAIPPLTDPLARPVARRALVLLAALLLACPRGQVDGSTEPGAATTAEPGPRTIVPKGLVHVRFDGVDEAPQRPLSWQEAARQREGIDAARVGAATVAGHRRWFFHAFDRATLVFFIARWEPQEPSGGVYHAESVILVQRSKEAERALEVDEALREYETGRAGLRAGMRPEEVEAQHGAPTSVQELGPFGSFDYLYADVCVRFLDGRVAHLWAPQQCAAPAQ
ncbi:MAG: hypothetical protein R3B09_29855 [Nannocystaceae bacterium]